MSERKLSYAHDATGRVVNIDSIKDKDTKYFCPFCNQPVHPKTGSEKVWHFAHTGGACFASQYADDGQNQSLDSFQTKTSAKVEFGETKECFCEYCNAMVQKVNAKQMPNKRYICKICFPHLSIDELKKYM